ncbi:Calnexin [Phaffia rhodozyma]|uniref:Calnexin n=1 Tax=Phaffia rhodozyma TaxID=264483 RepID=A0A0F7SL61_PHARH|nr:Calnexin [Phaffia rhodozyma]
MKTVSTLAILSGVATLSSQVAAEPVEFQASTIKAPFVEQFTPDWRSRWSPSHATKKSPVGSGETFSYVGTWSVEPPSVYPGIPGDDGLVVKSKAAHHAISAPIEGGIKVEEGKPLVVQYETKLQKGLECGGAYVKLLSLGGEQEGAEFSDKTPFSIMFGPDKCGATNKVHFIFRHKNPVTGEFEEKHLKATPPPKITKTTALYTLIVNPDNTFEIKINDETLTTGSLLEDFEPAVNPPREIDDPEDVKPEDWVDEAMITDSDATKPDDWDESAPALITDEEATMPEGWLIDEPDFIPDPEAVIPEEWDEEEDGDWIAPLVSNPACEEAPGCGPWTAPQIPNPDYKGLWSAPLIANPAYKGVWAPRKIANPSFFEDNEPAKGLETIGGVGFEVWTMTEDMLFDNIYIGHSVADAKAFADETFHIKYPIETAAETAALDEDVEDKAVARTGLSKVTGVIQDRIDFVRDTWPEFFEEAVKDWRSAIKTYPEFLATVVLSALTILATLATLFSSLFGGAPTTIQSAPKTKKVAVVPATEVEPPIVGVEVTASGVERREEELKQRKGKGREL